MDRKKTSGVIKAAEGASRASRPGSKRMLGIWIYDILRQHSSRQHPMTHQMIIEKLKEKYQYGCMRSTLASYLHDFESNEFRQTFGCYVRCDKRGAGYYLDREISDGELRLLIDSVMSIRALSAKDVNSLCEKLVRRGSPSFQQKVKGYRAVDLKELPHSPNKETMENVIVLNEAMVNSRQVSFVYNDFVLDASDKVQLEPRRKERDVVNPYRLTVYNNRLYLVCIPVSFEQISMYRVDKMTEAKVEKISCTPWLKFEKNNNPPQIVRESLHMFPADSVNIEFWVEKGCIRDVVDWFGADLFKVRGRDKNGRIHIEVRCSETAMQFWAMSYGEYVEIIKPQSLRETMRNVALEIYDAHK